MIYGNVYYVLLKDSVSEIDFSLSLDIQFLFLVVFVHHRSAHAQTSVEKKCLVYEFYIISAVNTYSDRGGTRLRYQRGYEFTLVFFSLFFAWTCARACPGLLGSQNNVFLNVLAPSLVSPVSVTYT